MFRKKNHLLLLLIVLVCFGCNNNAINNIKLKDYSYIDEEHNNSLTITFNKWLNDRKDGKEVEIYIESTASDVVKDDSLGVMKYIKYEGSVVLVSYLESGKPIVLTCGKYFDLTHDQSFTDSLYINNELISKSAYNIDISKLTIGYIQMTDFKTLDRTYYALNTTNEKTGEAERFNYEKNEFVVIDEAILQK